MIYVSIFRRFLILLFTVITWSLTTAAILAVPMNHGAIPWIKTRDGNIAVFRGALNKVIKKNQLCGSD